MKHYGSAAVPAKSPFALGNLERGAILACLFVPWSAFAVVSGVLTFTLHYDSPGLCWFIVWSVGALVLVCCYLAVKLLYMRFIGHAARDPTWYILLAVSLLCAWGVAVFLGSVNYWSNVRPVKDIELLSVYPHVDLSKVSGQQLMDTGRVTFVEGTHLDLKRSMGFKNLERYCVAPITVGNTTLATYDFWAVGLNCCSGAGDFHCGEYSNPRARSGLRLMREDQRPFYRLAVQQAEASFGISSPHPLFFYWMQDPVAELDAYQSDAVKYYIFGLLSFLCFQTFNVLVAIVLRTKLARG